MAKTSYLIDGSNNESDTELGCANADSQAVN